MLQSAGSSGTIALAYGVIADIALPHERGGYVGTAHIDFNSTSDLGPVIGGLLTRRVGWRPIFWFLAIISGFVFTILLIFFPEMSQKLVGDGSIQATGINKSSIDHFTQKHISTSKVMPRPQMNMSSVDLPQGYYYRHVLERRLLHEILVFTDLACSSFVGQVWLEYSGSWLLLSRLWFCQYDSLVRRRHDHQLRLPTNCARTQSRGGKGERLAVAAGKVNHHVLASEETRG